MKILVNLKSKADEAIFVGYAIAGKAYRVYNLRLNIVMESVHVVFDDKKISGLLDDCCNYSTVYGMEIPLNKTNLENST